MWPPGPGLSAVPASEIVSSPQILLFLDHLLGWEYPVEDLAELVQKIHVGTRMEHRKIK
jgi:hypothetical protein